MPGLIVTALLTLAVMFVMAPLGVFVWFGLPADALLFKPTYRLISCSLLIAYYGFNVWLLTLLVKVQRRWIIGVAILGLWIAGLLGFFEVFQEVGARFAG